LLELINEILDLSRIESGRLTLTLEPVVVAGIVKECIPLVTPLADKSGIHIDVDKSVGSLPHIQADLTRFKQVLLNLLTNAIKYNRPGGSVSLIGKVEKKVVCLEVTDNGIGISREQMKDLFVPFVRLGQDDSGIEGTGIGMTISKQLMGLMHGTLDAESEADVGSVFRLKLPIAEDGVVENVLKNNQGTTGQSETGFERNATFLYIEDNPSNTQLMKFIIEQWPQYSLVVRKNAEKGIKAAGMLKPDIIFMDLHLPGMTGQEAFTELQKDPKTKDIPVIALSADALPATVEGCLELGFVSYLTKPIEIESLRMEIEKCLQS
jgi:CheY-like chemotaxis protein/anti-sigma regulatory factor (Ser/Thr protein kinase)